MRDLAQLPQWVWRLLDALDRWEEEHPKFYRLSDNPDDVEYESTSCGKDRWEPFVPMGAWDALEIWRAARKADDE